MVGALQARLAENEKERQAVRVMLAEAAQKAEEEEEENKRAMGRVLGDLSHTRESLCVGEEDRKKREGEVEALRALLAKAEQKRRMMWR